MFSLTTGFASASIMDEGMNLQAGAACSFAITDDDDSDCCFLDNFN